MLPALPRRFGEVVSARIAIYVAFFNLGFGSGIWAVFIPVVRARLDINEGILGLVLLVIALGSVVAMPATGGAIARYGSRRLAAIAAILMPLAATLPLLAPSLVTIFAAAVVMGASLGVLDVSMNNEAARVEAVNGRPLMSGFHGLYSIGGLVGAGIGAALVALGDEHAFGAAGALVLLSAVAFLVRDWHFPSANRPLSGFRLTLPSRQLLGIGLLAFLCFGLEGAVADWSALFLGSAKDASPAVAAAGYAAFAGAMSVMRFLGDRLIERFGRARAITLGGLIIAIGCAIALLSPWALLSAAGFGLIGIGAANVVPVLFSTAAKFPASSGGVSAVSTIGYFGTLSWPPVIGGIAHVASLPLALWLIVGAGLVIMISARLVRPPEPADGPSSGSSPRD